MGICSNHVNTCVFAGGTTADLRHNFTSSVANGEFTLHINPVSQVTAISFLVLFKMIAELEWTQSNAKQNKDKNRTPTRNVKYIKHQIDNSRTTALERTAA